MDRLKLSRIDEELESSEVDALCFLCRDVVNRKSLEKVNDAKVLFLRLEEKGLLVNEVFLSELLQTIGRADLVNLLRTDDSQWTETDANPVLSQYRVMLYQIHEDITKKNLENMKVLLEDKLGRRPTEMCKTALDVFAEMEKKGLMSNTNLNELYTVLRVFNQQLAGTVQNYIERLQLQPPLTSKPHFSRDYQNTSNYTAPAPLSVSESQNHMSPSPTSTMHNQIKGKEATTKIISPVDEDESYQVDSLPTGLCLILNNINFKDGTMRRGTERDAECLAEVFSWVGFKILMCEDQTMDEMNQALKCFSDLSDTSALEQFNVKQWSSGRFINLQQPPKHGDVFICCILTHGNKGVVYGTDRKPLSIKDITGTFRATNHSPLTAKPKVFLIQACQGKIFERGVMLEDLETDECHSCSVPEEADVLVAVATVEDCVSFRDPVNGSWFIQSLCQQLKTRCLRGEDIHSILQSVNNEVSLKEGNRDNPGLFKQMPEVHYTLRKKLVFPLNTTCHN